MSQKLHQTIASNVNKWRDNGYESPGYPAISEILDFQVDAETGARRFLRQAQIQALETYWYLRLKVNTPRIIDLYESLYPRKRELIDSLGIPKAAFEAVDFEIADLWTKIRHDDEFVKNFKLEALRETLTLDYPSYILALAMGAGKTL